MIASFFQNRKWTALLGSGFLAYALWLRFHYLGHRPAGLDSDEAQILMEARAALRDGRFFTYSPSGYRWEMLAGYVYALTEKISPHGWPLRIGPALIGVLELGLFAALVRKLLSEIRHEAVRWTDVLAPVAALALCPWHLYYSRILGTCTGSSGWIMAMLLMTSSAAVPASALTLSTTGSLLWYTTLRISAFFFTIEAALKGSRGRAWAVFSALPLALAVVAVSSSPLRDFITRGAQNLETPDRQVLANYWGALVMPFRGIAERFTHFDSAYIADWVHLGLYRAVAGAPLLSISLAVFSLLGLMTTARSIARRSPLSNTLRRSIFLLLTAFGFLGFLGPSSSRFLLVVPLLLLPAIAWLEAIPLRWRGPLWGMLLSMMAFESHAMLQRLADSKLMEPVFPATIAEVAERISYEFAGVPSEQVIWIAGETSYVLANEIQQRRSGFKVLPPIAPETMETILRGWARGREQYVILNEHSPAFLAIRTSTEEGMKRIEEHLRYYAQILEERQILSSVENGTLARVLKIRWYNPECLEWCHP